MTKHCPTCGQPLPFKSETERLLELLKIGAPHREVYRAADGSGWYVTYGGGRFSEKSVKALVSSAQIRDVWDVYSDLPNQCYHVGRTLDVARTMAERKKHRRGKDAPKIYVDDPVAEGASTST